jgi:TolB-like protein
MAYNIRKFMQTIILAIFFCLATVVNSSAYEAEINKLSATMAQKIAIAKKAKVAVVDFTDLQGDVTELGRFIAEEFSVAIAGAGKGFKVVDRTHLKSIIKEHKLSATGIIDPKTARKLGKIAGVEALVTGTLTPFGDTVRIAVKILDTATAEVIDAKTGNIAKTEAIKELLGTSITFGDPLQDRKINLGKPLQTVEEGGFIFQLRSCKLSNKTIKCSFIITSSGRDKKLIMHGNSNSRLFDYEGNEYGAGKAQIGNSSSSSGYHANKTLISGIPTKASISLGGIPPEIKGIAVLEVHCYSFDVQFRNIPLYR